jgi:Uncharacterized protein conserved in bacteria
LVGFRVSEEENDLINMYAEMLGMTKQDYIISCTCRKDIKVNGNPRVFKALKDQVQLLIEKLEKIDEGQDITPNTEELLYATFSLYKAMIENKESFISFNNTE